MNKIYKLVWSKVRNCYVVTSELAKSHSKSKSGRNAIMRGMLVAAVLGLLPVSGLAADLPKPNQPLVNSEKATGVNSIALGEDSKADSRNSIALSGGTASGYGSVAIGEYATTSANGAFAFATAPATSGHSFLNIEGLLSDEELNAFQMPKNIYTAEATQYGSVIFGSGKSSGHYSVALGKMVESKGFGTLATGERTVAAGFGSFASGLGAQSTGSGTSSMGVYTTASGNGTIATGVKSIASGNGSVAMGLGTKATGGASVALGHRTEAKGLYSFAVGTGTVASTASDVAIGDGSNASGGYSLATGVRTEASGAVSTAMGQETKATGHYSTALGYKTEATDDMAFATGYNAKANGQWSIAMGLNATATTEGGIAIGSKTTAGYYGFAAGNDSQAIGMSSVALAGGKTEHDAHWSVAAGKDATAKLENSVALGSNSVAKIAKGKVGYDPLDSKMSAFDQDNHHNDTTGVWKSTENAIAVGDPDNKITRQITGVAAGSEDTDAVNVAQLKALETKVSDAAATAGKATTVKDGDHVTVTEETNDAGGKEYTVSVKTDGTVESGNTGIVSGDTVYKETRVENDGTYVKKDKTAGENLSALDTQVKSNADNIATNTSDITNLKNLDNISTGGQTVIKNLAKGAVKVIDGTNTTVTEGTDGDAKTYAVNVSNDAIKGAVATDLAGKADKDAGNIAGTDLTAWQTKLGNGTVANGNTGLVTGGTLYNEVRPGTDGEYVKTANTTAQNMGALDTQVKSNADNIAANTQNITQNAGDITNLKNMTNISDAGKNIIKDLAKDAVKVVNGTNTTVTEGTDGDTKTYAVNVSTDAIKGAVASDLAKKVDKDASNLTGADVTKWQEKLGTGTVAANDKGLVTGGTLYNEVRPTTDGSYVKSTNTTAGNLTALDTQVKSNTDAIHEFVTQTTTNLAGKADTDAGNLTGTDVGKWQEKLGTGTVASGDTGLVTGGKVYDETRVTSDGNYVQAANSAAQNLTAMDTQMKATADEAAKHNTVAAGHNIKVTESMNGNGGTRYTVAIADDFHLDSFTSGNTTVDGHGVTIRNGDPSKTVTVSEDGLNNGGNKITNVAPGTEDTDAATVGQVKQVVANQQNVGQAINKLDSRVNKVGAHAAALAALHPLDYDRDNKLDFAAGIGGYRGQKALAVGAFYRPNSRTMLSLGGSTGGGENMINFGISFKTGPGNVYEGVSKAQLIAENEDLKRNDAIQDQKIQDQDQKIQELMKMVAELQQKVK